MSTVGAATLAGSLVDLDVLDDEKVKDPAKWRVQPTPLFRRVVHLQWGEQEAPDIRPEKRRRRPGRSS